MEIQQAYETTSTKLGSLAEQRNHKEDVSTWEQCCSSFGLLSQSWFFPVTDIVSEVESKVCVWFEQVFSPTKNKLILI